MCDLGGEKDRFWLRWGELSQRQMRGAQDQTGKHSLTQYALCIGSNQYKIHLLCEDQNRTGFQDSGFKSSDDKECLGRSFRSEGISSVGGLFSDKSGPGLQVLSVWHVVISTSILSSKPVRCSRCLGPCFHVGISKPV